MTPKPRLRNLAEKRLQISLSPRAYQAIDDLACLMGLHRSAIVHHMIEDNVDALADLANALRTAKERQDEDPSQFSPDFMRVSDRAETLATQAENLLHELSEKARDGRPARAPRSA